MQPPKTSLKRFDTGPLLHRASSAVDSGLDLLAQAVHEAWQIEVEDPRPRLNLRRAELAAAEEALGCSGTGRPVLAVAPMASSRLRREDAAEFCRAADWLATESVALYASRGTLVARSGRSLKTIATRGTA